MTYFILSAVMWRYEILAANLVEVDYSNKYIDNILII
jgi:hypothetical protein